MLRELLEKGHEEAGPDRRLQNGHGEERARRRESAGRWGGAAAKEGKKEAKRAGREAAAARRGRDEEPGPRTPLVGGESGSPVRLYRTSTAVEWLQRLWAVDWSREGREDKAKVGGERKFSRHERHVPATLRTQYIKKQGHSTIPIPA